MSGHRFLDNNGNSNSRNSNGGSSSRPTLPHHQTCHKSGHAITTPFSSFNNPRRIERWGRWMMSLVIGTIIYSQGHMFVFLNQNIPTSTTTGKDFPFSAGAGLLPGLPEGRSDRFPSIQERVLIYMSSWYLPPCRDADTFFYKYNDSVPTVAITKGDFVSINVSSALTRGQLFFAKQSDYDNCAKGYKIHRSKRLHRECLDIHESVDRALLWRKDVPTRPPILLRIADGPAAQLVPSFHYCREALSQDEQKQMQANNKAVSCSRLDGLIPPITWNLNTARFIGPMFSVANNDHVWEDKKDMAVFRGSLTGTPKRYDKNSIDAATFCEMTPRCRLALRYANSSLANVKLAKFNNPILGDGIVNGINLIGLSMTMEQQLQYKALIFLDGNDVSSGVKWGMLSRSVVLMQPSKFSSWALDELLQPYIHYLPLNEDLSNVEEQMRWITENDEKAKEIAHRSSLWMQDLVFHPNAKSDDKEIKAEILKRYATHFKAVA